MFVYQIFDLGTLPGGSNTYPNAINNKRHIVGQTRVSGQSKAFIWKNNSLAELPSLPDSYYNEAKDINDNDEIVGHSSSPNTNSSAWYLKNGVIKNINQQDIRCFAQGINARGNISGSSTGKPCKWINGVKQIMQGINTGHYGYAGSGMDINSKNQVFGFSGHLNITAATKWDTAGATINCDSPESYYPAQRWSFIHAANDLEIAVGYVIGHNNYPQAYYWGASGRGPLGTLTGSEPSKAIDINSVGQIVGYIDDGTGERATIWNGSIITDLNLLIDPGLGWRLTSATCLNDKGQIAGIGIRNGQSRAWMMTPAYSEKSLPRIPVIFWHIIFGVVTDGPGVVIGPRGPKPVPPWNPFIKLVPEPYRSVLKELLQKQKFFHGKK